MHSKKYYTYVEPMNEHGDPIYKTFSEDEILMVYKPYLLRKLKQRNINIQITDQEIIEEWVTINWAWPSDNEGKYNDESKNSTNAKS
jgi:hypothetical protein